MSNLIAVIEKTNTGFSGYVKDFDGLATVGESISEFKTNLKEVIDEEISYRKETGKDVSELKKDISYMVDLEQFFEHYKVINKTAFAEYIGINKSLFRQYTKGLAPLSSTKMEQITRGLHELATDIESIVLV